MKTEKIEVDVPVFEGYEFVRIGDPEKGDLSRVVNSWHKWRESWKGNSVLIYRKISAGEENTVLRERVEALKKVRAGERAEILDVYDKVKGEIVDFLEFSGYEHFFQDHEDANRFTLYGDSYIICNDGAIVVLDFEDGSLGSSTNFEVYVDDIISEIVLRITIYEEEQEQKLKELKGSK